jgi:hypothetical protein
VHDYYSVSKLKPCQIEQTGPRLILVTRSSHLNRRDRAAGRPKKPRIRGCLEKNPTKKKVRCSRCKGFGHFSKTCKLAEPTEDDCPPKTPCKRYNFPSVHLLLLGCSNPKLWELTRRKREARECSTAPPKKKDATNKKKTPNQEDPKEEEDHKEEEDTC